MSARLFIISTPIGNLKDISARAKEALLSANVVLAEDTRVSLKLLNHLDIKKKLISCHKFNEKSRLDMLQSLLKNGQDAAIVSDAGTPCLCDPGQLVIQTAIELGFEIVPIPGPTAIIQALIGSGLDSSRFSFEGFLPDKKKELKTMAQALEQEKRTMVFFVSPHGLLEKLIVLSEVFKDRPACVARELTKLHEEFIRGSIAQIHDFLSREENSVKLKGEFTLVIEGNKELEQEGDTSEEDLKEYIQMALSQNQSVKDISASCQTRFGVRKSDAYKLALEIMASSLSENNL
ncbi:MAG: 16S rRNA (cytidine(1402)-2'-O)-methyltransferase [Candidatus Melainabacteria bacterium]|nr:16S rRNA (cytidine(1402)-2'-O)-methyltransferase [Candidatus Melainabacteria bacterium]